MNPDIPSIIAGSGTTAATLVWWIRSLISEKKDLSAALAELSDRERKLTSDVLEALILTRNFQENHHKELSNLGGSITQELSTLTSTIDHLANDLKNSN